MSFYKILKKATSVIEDSSEFDPPTLTSALRLATTYDYPALRNFAIKHLQDASLSAIERIRLAREFGLLSWEEPAYVELCERDDAITTSEASVLGLNTFVELARIREKEQRRRGRDIDAMMDDDDDNESLSEDSHIPDGGVKTTESVALPANGSPSNKLQKKKPRRRQAEGAMKTNCEQSEPQASRDQKNQGQAEEIKSGKP